MNTARATPAAVGQPTASSLVLSGCWTAFALGLLEVSLAGIEVPAQPPVQVDATGIVALDTAGAWLLQGLVQRLQAQGHAVALQGLQPAFAKLLAVVAEQRGTLPAAEPMAPPEGGLQQVGRSAIAAGEQARAMFAFIGQNAIAAAGCVAHPSRLRWRTVLFNLRGSGFDALPIVGLLSFPLGVVVAYQGADLLQQYGANIFVADLVGLSMLREFAPLITAIIVAGRSGSAYAAQIGTMVVTEEIDAMTTLGIEPLELLVLPKIAALMIALPLLTAFADVMGVLGGMVMGQAQLGVSYSEFLDRFVKAVSISSYAVGLGKAPVFAAIIALVGCFQGFRARGGADSVGRQTTRAVVQSIFLVIVVDALFSVFFSALDL